MCPSQHNHLTDNKSLMDVSIPNIILIWAVVRCLILCSAQLIHNMQHIHLLWNVSIFLMVCSLMAHDSAIFPVPWSIWSTICFVVKERFLSQNTEPRKGPNARDALPILFYTSNATLPEASTKEPRYLKDCTCYQSYIIAIFHWHFHLWAMPLIVMSSFFYKIINNLLPLSIPTYCHYT